MIDKTMNDIQREDYQILGKDKSIDWAQLKGASFLITGSTGVIGSNLVYALLYNSQKMDLSLKVILPVRNTQKAEKLFAWADPVIIPYELGQKPTLDWNVDYIVHLASPTSSRSFVESPTEVISSTVEGNRALLEWARENPVKKYVFLSSMEVYGFPKKGHRVTEKELGRFDPLITRNSYPISKISCEATCNAYSVQYGIPTVILRATQTFGPGVEHDDPRVFGQMMRSVLDGKNIVLKSEGRTERCYLYTADAVSAILVALTKGVSGEAYSVANPKTYCSIAEMAEMVAEKIGKGRIGVKYDISSDVTELGYSPELYMDLDVSKLEKLGWRAGVGLEDMYDRMIRSLGAEV